MKKVKFYFDYISPFAYLTWGKLPELEQTLDIKFELLPILFAGLLNHWGQKGPAEIVPKRNYVFTQCLRYAMRKNIAFTLPKVHPFNPLLSLRLSLFEVAGSAQIQVIDTLWKAGWVYGKDLADIGELTEVLNNAGLPGEDFMNKVQMPEIKNRLKLNTEEAIKLGVFGVPTFVTDDNTLFWGLDSLADLSAYLNNGDKFDREYLEKFLSVSQGAAR